MTDSHIISSNSLNQFMSVVLNATSTTDFVDLISDSNMMEKMINLIYPDIEIGPESRALESQVSEIEKLIAFLHLIHKTLNEKYPTQINELIHDLSKYEDVSSLTRTDKCRVGEILILLSVESPEAANIFQMIITKLDEECQFDVQRTIEKLVYEFNESDSKDFQNKRLTDFTATSIDSIGNGDNPLPTKQQQQPPPKNLTLMRHKIPPLSLDLIQKQLSSTKFVSAGGDSPIWRKKYERLKLDYSESEANREMLQMKLDQLSKELDVQKSFNEKLIVTTKEASSVSQRNANDAVDSLEIEIEKLKDKLTAVVKEKNGMEKSLQNEIDLLKDENQMLSVDAEKVIRLEGTIERLKLKAEEGAAFRVKNTELENKIEEYMTRLVEIENLNKGESDLKQIVEMYKTKVTNLESQISNLDLSIDSLQRTINQQQTSLEEAEKKNIVDRLKFNAAISDYEAQLHDAQQHSSSGGMHCDDFNLREKLIRLEKENIALKESNQLSLGDAKIIEVELDDVTRLKEKFELDCKSALAKVALLESQGNFLDVNKVHESLNNELTLRKVQIESLEAQKIALQAQYDQEKLKNNLQENTLRSQIEGQFDKVVGTLKDQIKLREREINFYRLLREEQISIQRREEKLISSAFHELAFRIVQEKSEKEKIQNEYDAVLLNHFIDNFFRRFDKRRTSSRISILDSSNKPISDNID